MDAIAVVGISAELPSGNNSLKNLDHHDFFDFLLEGKQAYETVPKERFNITSWKGRGLGRIITDTGAFLKDISLFDHVEFGISSKDARSMSLSTRKLIELSFLALLDSGIDYRSRRVGCYASGIPFDILTIADPDEYEARGSFGGGPCMIANKISYHLDLLGPSIPIDTACSSSLTALHLAVQALRAGDCDAAIVGGCQLNHRFLDFIQYSQGGVLAPDGKCKPFDASADGFSRGEGAVVIVVKKLEDALRDGDHIYASVLGTAVTTNGSAAPVNAPVAESQAQAMEQAYIGTGRRPKDVDFLELHATGTAAGDPVEANWIGEKFHRDGELIIGSVKGNIGHLEITAFLASLVKVCSIFSNGVIPPNANFTTPNPSIKWEKYNLRVPTAPIKLIPRDKGGRTLVSMMSSGIGGVNGHAVIEGPPAAFMQEDILNEVDPVLLVVGGLSPRSSGAIVSEMQDSLATGVSNLPAISTIYGRRARQMTWRAFTVILPDCSVVIPFEQPVLNVRRKKPIVFVFPGQGPQHFEMGRQLYRRLARFKAMISRLDGVYFRRTGKSFVEMTGLFADKVTNGIMDLSDVWPIAIILPAIAMIQIALVDTLESVGIVPDMLIGHSAGETTILYASGAASAEMAFELAVARGEAMSIAEAHGGTMAALSCSAQQAQSIIEAVVIDSAPHNVLEIACYNATDSVTLAGNEELVERAIDLAKKSGYLARKIRTKTAVHSSCMDVCKETYERLSAEIFKRYSGPFEPKKPVYSTFTGKLYTEAFTSKYFWNQTRYPVRFSEAASNLSQGNPNAIYVEIGPHPVLAPYLVDAGADPSMVFCPMKRAKSPPPHHEMQTYLKAIGQIVVNGCNSVDFCALNGYRSAPRVQTIKYPFLKKHIAYYPDDSAIVRRQMAARNGPLNSPYLSVNIHTHPTIAQHIIQGEPIMPAAGYLEMAFEFGAQLLWNVTFRSMLSLPSEKVTRVDVSSEGSRWQVRSTASNGGNSAPRLHADGYMSFDDSHALRPAPLDIGSIRDRCQPMSTSGFYSTLSYFANYGPMFQRVKACWKGIDEALVEVRGADVDLPDVNDYLFHPAVLDACLHIAVHPAFTGNADRNTYYLPAGVKWVHLSQGKKTRLPSTLFAHVTFKLWRPDGLVIDFVIVDSNGNHLCSLTEFEVAAHERTPLTANEKRRFDMIHQPLSIQAMLKTSGGESVPGSRKRGAQMYSDIHGHGNDPSHMLSCAFGRVYSHIKAAGKRIIRVLDFGNDLELTKTLCEDLLKDTSTYCAFDLCLLETQNYAHAVAEPLKFIYCNRNQPLQDQFPWPATYDIILGWPSWVTLESSLATLSSLLVHGGILLAPKTDSLQSVVGLIQTNPWFLPLSQEAASTIDTTPMFVLMAQKAPISAIPHLGASTPGSSTPLMHVHAFKRTHELDIQTTLRNLEPETSLWIHATADLDGAAARGFSRSLRKEILNDVHLILFDASYPLSQRDMMVYHLATITNLEQEVLVDSTGRILVPRLIASSSPNADSLRAKDYWRVESAGVIQEPLPWLEDGHILVRVVSTSKVTEQLFAVHGIVADTKSATFAPRQSVVGLVADGRTNYCTAHEGMFAPLFKGIDEQAMLAMVGGLIVASSVLGIHSLNRQRLHNHRILVTNASSTTGRSLVKLFSFLGLDVNSVHDSIALEDFATIRRCDLVFSSFNSEERIVLEGLLSRDARVNYWNDSETGVGAALALNQWMVFDTLPHLSDSFASLLDTWNETVEGHVFKPSTLIPSNATLVDQLMFDPSGVYVLVGGIGSLGLQIALWMYKASAKGARNVVLTSRSGRKSLMQNSTLALRTLSYLEGLPDFYLTLEQCDASSIEATKALFSRISGEIRGIILLAVQLSDKTFLSHSQESFQTPFRAKEGGFHAVEQSLCTDELDFFVTLSANTVLDELTRTKRNAFSLIAPAIIDSSTIARTDDLLTDSRLAHWAPWAMSSKEICQCLEDGIKLLRKDSFWLYVPDYDWFNMQKHFGSSPIYDYLIRTSDERMGSTTDNETKSLQEVVLRFLDVQPDDFDTSVPFTSYALDSLSAGRLSAALKPFIVLTQLQLLADISLDDIFARMSVEKEDKAEAGTVRT
ncbi:hypothetical protein BU17DRAFT_83380 [Hysterangium stoloniferum]|nr:hypothetical protein BU17DRAFT_83380 [Hysterangium stoloniferum]